MRPTEALMQEHRGIELVLDVMEIIVDKLKGREEVDRQDLEKILEFLRVFTDRCHHGKEEELLFPALVETGLPGKEGLVGVMLEEHRMGREFIGRLADAIAEYKKGKNARSKGIIKSASGYIRLLRDHIHKEDNILYRIADERLTPERQAGLLEGFERIERERIGEGKHEEFHRFLEALEKKYL